MKFKIGDKIRFYGNSQGGALNAVPHNGLKGEIVYIHNDGWINVSLDMNGIKYTVHRKQCRKLVKRKRVKTLQQLISMVKKEIKPLTKEEKESLTKFVNEAFNDDELDKSLCPASEPSFQRPVVLNHYTFKKIWDEYVFAGAIKKECDSDSHSFRGFCKELGFK